MRAIERCGCGASLEVESRFEAGAEYALRQWRADHQHAPAAHPDAAQDEPHPAGDTYASTERADTYGGPSIGFRVPDADPEYYDRTERP